MPQPGFLQGLSEVLTGQILGDFEREDKKKEQEAYRSYVTGQNNINRMWDNYWKERQVAEGSLKRNAANRAASQAFYQEQQDIARQQKQKEIDNQLAKDKFDETVRHNKAMENKSSGGSSTDSPAMRTLRNQLQVTEKDLYNAIWGGDDGEVDWGKVKLYQDRANELVNQINKVTPGGAVPYNFNMPKEEPESDWEGLFPEIGNFFFGKSKSSTAPAESTQSNQRFKIIKVE